MNLAFHIYFGSVIGLLTALYIGVCLTKSSREANSQLGLFCIVGAIIGGFFGGFL